MVNFSWDMQRFYKWIEVFWAFLACFSRYQHLFSTWQHKGKIPDILNASDHDASKNVFKMHHSLFFSSCFSIIIISKLNKVNKRKQNKQWISKTKSNLKQSHLRQPPALQISSLNIEFQFHPQYQKHKIILGKPNFFRMESR